MKRRTKFFPLCLVTLIIISFYIGLSHSCVTPSTIPKDSTWVSSPGCMGTYNTPTRHCHCWGHCGYICDPLPQTPPTPPNKYTGTCKIQNANGPSTLKSGESWIQNENCMAGEFPGQVLWIPGKRLRCRCWAYCGYICEHWPKN